MTPNELMDRMKSAVEEEKVDVLIMNFADQRRYVPAHVHVHAHVYFRMRVCVCVDFSWVEPALQLMQKWVMGVSVFVGESLLAGTQTYGH